MTRAAGGEVEVKRALAERLEGARGGLLTCVQCGFCVPACPTWREVGDEADSPRGRLHLMRAVVEDRLDPASDAFQDHIDRCLGCRACEPVCPSGVPYGSLLEAAREVAYTARPARRRPGGIAVPLLLALFRHPAALRLVFGAARAARALRLPTLVRKLPGGRGPKGGGGSALRLGAAMLEASGAPSKDGRRADRDEAGHTGTDAPAGTGGPTGARVSAAAEASSPAATGPRVALLSGCVQGGLFGRVLDASERVLARNRCRVVRFGAGGCCGALHAHAGERRGALSLARRRIAEGERLDADLVATDAAGCGAAMKEYGEWFEDDPEWAERAAAFAARVRGLCEILVDLGPAVGGEVRRRVVHSPPCHLRHAQRVDTATERVLSTIPGLEVRTVSDPNACCGGAGIYGITHPDLGGAIGDRKVADVRSRGVSDVVTGNPGCMMQIGAGLLLSGSEVRALHPVELLDESYRAEAEGER